MSSSSLDQLLAGNRRVNATQYSPPSRFLKSQEDYKSLNYQRLPRVGVSLNPRSGIQPSLRIIEAPKVEFAPDTESIPLVRFDFESHRIIDSDAVLRFTVDDKWVVVGKDEEVLTFSVIDKLRISRVHYCQETRELILELEPKHFAGKKYAIYRLATGLSALQQEVLNLHLPEKLLQSGLEFDSVNSDFVNDIRKSTVAVNKFYQKPPDFFPKGIVKTNGFTKRLPAPFLPSVNREKQASLSKAIPIPSPSLAPPLTQTLQSPQTETNVRRSTRLLSKEITQIHEPKRSPSDEDEFVSPFTYTFCDGKTEKLEASDYNRLGEEEFLNDTMIHFFLKLALNNRWLQDGPQIGPTHIFNTFFFEKLTQKTEDGKPGYENVKRWTSKIDIFAQQSIIIPIHSNLHWYVAIIFNPSALLNAEESQEIDLPSSIDSSYRKTRSSGIVTSSPLSKPKRKFTSDDASNSTGLFIIDSLGSTGHSRYVFRTLRDYLASEALDKKQCSINRENIFSQGICAPQQTNFCDCGVFLVHYVERYLSNPSLASHMFFDQTSNKEELKKFWNADALPTKRLEMRSIIMSLQKQATGKIDANDNDKTEQSTDIIVEEVKQRKSTVKFSSKASNSDDDYLPRR